MSKHDGEIRAAEEVPGALKDLLAGLDEPTSTGSDRQDAMAHFLSGEEGWRDAHKTLRGTFAKPRRGTTGLSTDSDK